ncbi:putative leader peptide [Streptomyces sp. NPDC002499]
MHVPGATARGARIETLLTTRRHVDYCRTASAVCPSVHV